jgi:phage terminase small subunit
VRERVDELIAVAAEKAGVTIERVLTELARIGFSDMRQVAEWGPGGLIVKESSSLTDDAAAAIVEVGKTREGIKVKLCDKAAALEKLGKHLGMFREKVEVAGVGGGPVQISMPPTELMRRLAYLLTKPKDAA